MNVTVDRIYTSPDDATYAEWNIYDDMPYPTLLGKVIRYASHRYEAWSGTGLGLGDFKTKRDAVAKVVDA